jgi:hypothetical protein
MECHKSAETAACQIQTLTSDRMGVMPLPHQLKLCSGIPESAEVEFRSPQKWNSGVRRSGLPLFIGDGCASEPAKVIHVVGNSENVNNKK